ncbi:MAG: amino acid ABC transporter permease, partial [Acidimicrobiia bacterium]|nr:amino acid ABC transporter permease [Acidimicrobiia bacterium]
MTDIAERDADGPDPRLGRRRSATADLLREEGAKGALIGFVSTVAFFGLAGWLIVSSPNWPKVRNQFFNGEDFRESWPDVVDGFWLNLELFFYAMLTIPVAALLLAVLRSFRGPAFFPLRLLAVVFIDVFRGIPLILLILLLGFGVPALDLPGLPNGAMFWGLVALT